VNRLALAERFGRAAVRLGLTGFFALWALSVRLAKFRLRLIVG
jgi:hypothetical protein